MIARPCKRHEDPRTCADIVKTREKAIDAWEARAGIGWHKRPWPGADAERRLPFVCGKRIAPGGVR